MQKVKNHTSSGIFAEANHIMNSWVMSCEPRVKSPALRGMFPRAEWCCSLPGRARSDQVSGRGTERLHPAFGFGDQRAMGIGVLALDDEVGDQEQILGRELPAPVCLAGARHDAQELLERDSQEVRSGDVLRGCGSLRRIGQRLRKPEGYQNCFSHHHALRKGLVEIARDGF